MRIHSDTLTYRDLYDAARIARVTFDKETEHGSRKRDHAFEVTLTGESRRRPNAGTSRSVDRFNRDDYAATWDQWGVFLAVLFDRDPNMVTPYYADAAAFHRWTDGRFGVDEAGNYWPSDAHGDHTFRFNGTVGMTTCTKCSAAQRWQT